MASVKWDHSKFLKSTVTKAMDGLEEIARGPILTRCKEECPVKDGIMRGSLGVERSDSEKCVYIGGGGPSAKYIFRQHQDTTLNHPVGKAKFIADPIQALSSQIPKYIEKHIK
jgi:hypothetical protein